MVIKEETKRTDEFVVTIVFEFAIIAPIIRNTKRTCYKEEQFVVKLMAFKLHQAHFLVKTIKMAHPCQKFF